MMNKVKKNGNLKKSVAFFLVCMMLMQTSALTAEGEIPNEAVPVSVTNSEGGMPIDGEAVSEDGNAASEGEETQTDPTESVQPEEETETEESFTGLKKIGGKLYYLIDDEPFTKGYKAVEQNGKRSYYYFTEDGSAFTDGYKEVTISGKKKYFFFRSNGVAFTNGLKKVTIDGKKYYFYFKENGRALIKEWKTIDDKTYYFGKDGRALTGKNHAISHYLCSFNSKGELQRKIDKNKKMVALTYDDGPSVNTKKILNTLEKYDSVATFFVVGNRVSSYSSSVKRAYEIGCEIGNHTYDHKILTNCNAATIQSQYKKTNTKIKSITGENPVLFRPPGGGLNQTARNNVKMPLILWSVDTLDWKYRNSRSVQTAVLNKVKDGDIVLMHDLYETTANASAVVIPELVKRGYQLVTVSELAACRGEMKNGVSYYSFRK